MRHRPAGMGIVLDVVQLGNVVADRVIVRPTQFAGGQVVGHGLDDGGRSADSIAGRETAPPFPVSKGITGAPAAGNGPYDRYHEEVSLKALFIWPEFPDTFWSFRHAIKFVRKSAACPPLGLITVAALLPADWEIRLVDTNIRRLTEADLAWADLVFLGAMNIQRRSASQIIARCKAAGKTVVAGGPLFTSEHEQFPQVDHFVLNEAELTLPPFLEDLERGRAGRLYTTSEFADIEKTPPPRWDLLELPRYDSMNIQFSRGCPFNCEFCYVTALLGHRPRTKTPAQMLAELDALHALGWRRRIFFVDDNFIGNKKVLKAELLPALIEWRRAHPEAGGFSTEVSINLADDEDLMRQMVQAGFDTVFVGIETPAEEGLAECNKVQNRGRNLIESVRRLHRNGLQVQAGFIVGFDSDTPSIFQRQIDFIMKSGIVTAMVGLLQAPYGTDLYKRLQREGRLVDEMSGDNADGSTNIIPRMPLETLRQGYQRILAYIYAPDNFYRRVRTFLQDYNPRRMKVQLSWTELKAWFLTIYHLGIRGQERLQYWRLFFWTMVHKPRLVPLAVTLAVYGHHFRRIYEAHLAPQAMLASAAAPLGSTLGHARAGGAGGS